MSFLNKVAIVTGGSSGIGASIAAKLSAEGAFVAIVGRNLTKLAAVSEKCKHNKNKPLVIAGDITHDDTAKKIISETVNKFGKIDILVNNAGATNLEPSILYPKALQEFDNLMNLNVRLVVNLTNLAAPHLVTSKGNIINISSIAGLRPYVATGFAYNT
ncbi:short chain dehydrogenase domain-containing protein [Phthorimaea operculella]|nr:short chain dehydrogenase domain-containing protein [Phthorimaea operculella]